MKGRRSSFSTGPGAWPTRKNRAPAPPSKVGLASGSTPSRTQRVQARHSRWSLLSWRAMRTLGVVGDTQGRYRVPELLETLAHHFATVDEIWHAGDWQEAAVLEGLANLGKPLYVVNGNAPDDPRYPERISNQV